MAAFLGATLALGEEPNAAASVWVERLIAGHDEADHAVLEIGPVCVPYLLDVLAKDDVTLLTRSG